jgi:Histidine kinase
MPTPQKLEQVTRAYEALLCALGHQIHDGSLQYLAGAKMWLGAVDATGSREQTAQCLQRATDACEQAIHALRRTMNEAEWMIPETAGIASQISMIFGQFSVPIEVANSESQFLDSLPFPRAAEIVLSRALTEILFNLQAAGSAVAGCSLIVSRPDHAMTLWLPFRSEGTEITPEVPAIPKVALLGALGSEVVSDYNHQQAIWGWKLTIPLAEIEAFG